MIHVIGAGIAGLSCAVRLVARGHNVRLYDAAPYAGGRCRSFYDKYLECWIDNGNHLILSGNRGVLEYLRIIERSEGILERGESFPFMDLESGERWEVRPNKGIIPWWICVSGRRILGTRLGEYLSLYKLLLASPQDTVDSCISSEGPLYRRFWYPVVLAVLNTTPERGAAYALRRVFWETFFRGLEYCRPLLADRGLGRCFIDPAVTWLRAAGVEVSLARRVRKLFFTEGIQSMKGMVCGFEVGGQRVFVAEGDYVVVAVPGAVAQKMVPDLTVPQGEETIINTHFRHSLPLQRILRVPFIGVVGGTVHWIFFRDDVLSVTVSGGGWLESLSGKEIAERMWLDVCRVCGLEEREVREVPRYRVIKEHRATFLQTPQNFLRRPQTCTKWENLFLAGDWTDTGLPATLEGAVRSGFKAANEVEKSLAQKRRTKTFAPTSPRDRNL